MVADIAKLSVGREEYYTRELATDHEQYLSGHGECPGRWYSAGAAASGCRAKHPWPGSAMFEGRDPTTGELLGRPHGRNAVPAFDVVLRPTKSVSILYGLGDPATGRAVLAAHHAGLAEAVAYLDEQLGARRGHGGASTCPDRGCWPSGSTTGPPGKVIRCCTPIWWSPTGSRGRTAAGQPWTAGTCTGIGWPRTPSTGPPTSGSCPDARGGVDGGRPPRQPGAPGHARGAGPAVLQAHRPDRAELDRLAADGRERTPRLVKWAVHATRKPKEHEAPDTLYGRWRAEAAERGRGPGHPGPEGDRPDTQPGPGPDGVRGRWPVGCSTGWPARTG